MSANASVHPELRSLVSQFCALECCPPDIREALSSFLMTGDIQAANDLRKSSTWNCDDIHLYWGGPNSLYPCTGRLCMRWGDPNFHSEELHAANKFDAWRCLRELQQ